MSSHTAYFDIETSPLPDSYLDMICPVFDAPSNWKDPEKIAANLTEQKAKWKTQAALSPLTGKILCVGVLDIDGSFMVIDGDGDERALLEEFKRVVDHNKDDQFVGFNIHSFDLPFLMKRAWRNGLAPCVRPGTYLARSEKWIDLRAIWQCGDRTAPGSLDVVAKFLGVGAKTGSGADFAGLWDTDKPAAIEYLRNDLNLTMEVAERMGVAF